MKTSGFLSINWRDFGKGLLVAMLTAIVNFIMPLFQAGNYHIDWKVFGTTVLAAFIAYISKNLLTNSKDEFATPEPNK